MRRIAGLVLLIVGGFPMLFLPPVIIWAILECGPVDSSCHHPPVRLAGFIIAGLVIVCAGAWLAIDPRKPR